jgi:hypothetical protein
LRSKLIHGATQEIVIKDEFILDIKESLKEYKGFKFSSFTSKPTVIGQWEVKFEGVVYETYDIKITFDGYPEHLPKVYETSNKIPHEEDMHFNPPDWHACLFVSHQRWEVFPKGSSFLTFLKVPVHNFFLGQSFFSMYGHWPEGRERGHGNKGIVEYYQELFGTKDKKIIYSLLRETFEESIPRQKKCPCNKKKRLKNCHGQTVTTLKENQDPKLIFEAMQIFKKN